MMEVLELGVRALALAAARTPDPGAARLRSLGTHAVFGIGLYLSAEVLARLGA